jgi:hypothetical protein
MALTLVPAKKAHPDSDWAPDQYAVLFNGKPVGSIDKQAMAGQSERWFWEISTRESPGLLKGPADSLDEAMRLFREAWDSLD